MSENLKINSDFISTWHPKYDESENDEPEYQSLVAQIRKELSHNGTLSKETFIRVLDWKSPRVKGIARLSEFTVYEKAIAEVVLAANGQKLELLCRLRGIGAPVGSTLLHLMYPNEFPIIDIRTVQTLHYAGLLQSEATDLTRYPTFTSAIMQIANECPNFSLREIDRALFAYHKMFLASKLKGKPAEPKPKTTSSSNAISTTYSSGGTTDGKVKIHQKVLNVFKDKQGSVFSKKEIVDLVDEAYPGTKDTDSVLPPDYCYNMINKDRRSFQFRVFECTGKNQYKWLGPDYPYSGPITWNSEQVGKWEQGKCELWKDPRKH